MVMQAVGVKGALRGAGMGLPWGGGETRGPPADTRGSLRGGGSGGSKARAENPPERWPFLPHPVHSSPQPVQYLLLS